MDTPTYGEAETSSKQGTQPHVVFMTFLLYGANGYTGELIARRAVAGGLRPILGGRSVEPVARLAAELGLDYRIAGVDDAARLDDAIGEARLVLNCAGPFSRTAIAVASAAIRRGAHYLDITGEMDVFESLAARTDDAARAGVMLLPGVGFDVVPSDCLAAHVAAQLPSATHLAIAIQGTTRMSRGTALTGIEGLGQGRGAGAVRRDGRIVRVPAAWKTRVVDLGAGPVRVTT
ncbi:MAG: saccharopine dehydrogenase family protein, partial [Solirubrobacteraceae bacterium]